MTSTTENATLLQYRVYIKAVPQTVWEALTRAEWTQRYGYAPLVHYEMRAGGKYVAKANAGMKAMGAPDVVVDGEVIEVDPPHKLVQTWRMLMDDSLTSEGFTNITYELEPVRGGVTRLTLTHDVTGAPRLAALVSGEREWEGAGGGWNEVLSGLKTLLETGSQLPFQSGPNHEGRH